MDSDSRPVVAPYWNGEQPRPRFRDSDTWAAHESGLCGFDRQECDARNIHQILAREKRRKKAPARASSEPQEMPKQT